MSIAWGRIVADGRKLFAFCVMIDRFLSAGLAFVENHERFPSLADRVKINFGFMFSAKGKASYILRCVCVCL